MAGAMNIPFILKMYYRWLRLKLPNKDIILPTHSNNIQPKVKDDLVFELIETSDADDNLPDVESDLVSDKNNVASDINKTELQTDDLPFQSGETVLKTFNARMIDQLQQEQKQISKNESILDIIADIKKNKTSFMEDYKKRKEMNEFIQQNPEYDQELSKAKRNGGMSFNTYAWDFAPYMLGLKRKVQNHINPPYAFSHLGAIEGDALIRFKIMQDGSLQDLEILGSNAHYSFVQSPV